MRLTCLHVLGDADEALDALQDTLILLWRHQRELSLAANPGAYCRRTAHNVSISRLRASRHTEAIDATYDISDECYAAERIEHRDVAQRVRQLMEHHLTSQQRKIMEMRAIGDMTISDIAAGMNLTEGNVRQLISRARTRLRQLYDSLL